MRPKFIPVDNDVKKAIAFANSLDQNYLTNVQKVKQKTFYMPTLDIVNSLQSEGWQLKGVDEYRSNNRKIASHYLQMHHPDFDLKNSKGKTEAVSSLTISNSCSGNSPLTMDLGVYRMVCSNGLIAFDKHGESTKIRHIETDYNNLNTILGGLNNKVDKVLGSFNMLRNKQLTTEEAREFAYQAARLKYTPNEISDVTINDLLSLNRIEDEGNDLWNVYNRVQENLTENIRNMDVDINMNRRLSSLVDSFAI
jgi:hypothetical protein